MSSLKKTVYILILITLGLLLAISFTEITTRILAPDWLKVKMEKVRSDGIFFMGTDEEFPVIKENNKIKSLIPNSKFTVSHYEYKNIARTDDYGGRITQNSGQEDITIFLGDSFTFGVGVEDEETFVNLLSKDSKKHRNINLGVPGGAITNQLDILEMRHKELGNPKLYVFTVFLGNDLVDIYSLNMNQQPNSDLISSNYGLFWRINKFTNRNKLLNKFYSLQFIKQKVLNMINSGNTKLMDPIFMTSIKNNQYLPLAISYYNEDLLKLNKLSEELDFDFFFILIPDVIQIDQERMASKATYYNLNTDDLDFGLPNTAMHKILSQNKVKFIDITDCLKDDTQMKMLYYIYDNHLTKYGHQSVTRCIRESEYYADIIQRTN